MKYCKDCALSQYDTINNETKVFCRYKKQYVSPYDTCYGFQKEIKGDR